MHRHLVDHEVALLTINTTVERRQSQIERPASGMNFKMDPGSTRSAKTPLRQVSVAEAPGF